MSSKLRQSRDRAAALREVREYQIAWDPRLGDSGWFARSDDGTIRVGLLVALWDAKLRNLITVDGACVVLTDVGRAKLHNLRKAAA